MRVDSAPKEHTISRQLPAEANGQIYTLFHNRIEAFRDRYPIIPPDAWVNAYLTELYSYEKVISLPEISLPNYLDEDSRTERLTKTANMQWASSRFHLQFYTSESLTASWTEIGIIPVHRTAGFPFTRHRGLDYFTDGLARSFGEDARVGVSVINTGSGYPTTVDKICLDGSWKQELWALQPDFIPVVVNQGTVQQVTQYQDINTRNIGVASTQVLFPRSSRVTSSLKNNSTTSVVYYSYTSTVSSSSNNGSIPANSTVTLSITKDQGLWTSASAAATSITTTDVYQQ